jgi:hypothetical protein
MTAWFLFAILAFLVFGVPLIDEIYRRRVRRQTNNLQENEYETISLVPEMDEHLHNSRTVAPVRRLENV